MRWAPSRYDIVFAALLSGFAAPSAAQQEEPEAPDRWKFVVDVGFNGSTGNTRLTVLSAGYRITHLETDQYELDWRTTFRYGESEGDVVARSWKSTFSADWRPGGLWSPFAFTDFERDPFRRLDARTNAGAGVKRTFVESDDAALSLSLAALHNYENFTEPRGEALLDSQSDARWSFRAQGMRALNETVRVEHTSFFKPVWDEADDYNIDAVTDLTVRLNDRIRLKFTHTFRRDSTPPPEVLHNDQIFQVGITLEM